MFKHYKVPINLSIQNAEARPLNIFKHSNFSDNKITKQYYKINDENTYYTIILNVTYIQKSKLDLNSLELCDNPRRYKIL